MFSADTCYGRIWSLDKMDWKRIREKTSLGKVEEGEIWGSYIWNSGELTPFSISIPLLLQTRDEG